jgi:hypothetical protein
MNKKSRLPSPQISINIKLGVISTKNNPIGLFQLDIQLNFVIKNMFWIWVYSYVIALFFGKEVTTLFLSLTKILL